jgi:hypothetical protein
MSQEIEMGGSLPLDTRVFVCATCGAVALNPNDICQVQGMAVKADWCGTKSDEPPRQCVNRIHTHRYYCNRCKRVSVNQEVLCEPVQLKKKIEQKK